MSGLLRFGRRRGRRRDGLGPGSDRRSGPGGGHRRRRRGKHAAVLHLETVLRHHRDRVHGTADRALLAADTVVVDDHGLAGGVGVFREGELAVDHPDRFEGAVVEAMGAAHADFFVHDRQGPAAADVLLRPDLEALLVTVLRELDVHLPDAPVVRNQRVRGRRRGRGNRWRLRGGRDPDHPRRPGIGGSFRFASMLLPVGYSPGRRSARNWVMSITLYGHGSWNATRIFFAVSACGGIRRPRSYRNWVMCTTRTPSSL